MRGKYLLACAVLRPVMLCIAGILMVPKREGIVLFLAGLVDLTGIFLAIGSTRRAVEEED